MLDESLCRLKVPSNMFHPTCNPIHWFIWCQTVIVSIFFVIPIFLSFLNVSFSLFFAYFLWPACLFFSRYLQFLLLHLCILLHFDLVILINSNNLLRHCSSSFRLDACEIRSSNIQNDVIRIKCWMIQGINQSNLKTVLAEPENVDWNIFSRSIFIQYNFFSSNMVFNFFYYFWSNIYSNIAFLLCWLKCRIGLTRPLGSPLFVIHVNDSHDGLTSIVKLPTTHLFSQWLALFMLQQRNLMKTWIKAIIRNSNGRCILTLHIKKR